MAKEEVDVELAPTMNLNKPINASWNFPDGRSVSLYIPNDTGNQNSAIIATLNSIIKTLST